LEREREVAHDIESTSGVPPLAGAGLEAKWAPLALPHWLGGRKQLVEQIVRSVVVSRGSEPLRRRVEVELRWPVLPVGNHAGLHPHGTKDIGVGHTTLAQARLTT
jgi:hypothetical protein